MPHLTVAMGGQTPQVRIRARANARFFSIGKQGRPFYFAVMSVANHRGRASTYTILDGSWLTRLLCGL